MMRNRLVALGLKLRASYWFTPALMTAMAMILAFITLSIDEQVTGRLDIPGLIFVNSADGIRSVLATIAGSMMTVAGVVFSLTMVVLTLTSQQYGSLALENFMRDRANQIVLGTFNATFIYCLLVMRTVQDTSVRTFIPHISALISLGLAIASLAVLIYFIHHVSESIQANTIVNRISGDLRSAINQVYPTHIGTGASEDTEPPPSQFDQQAVAMAAPRGGYLQIIDDDGLLEIAMENDLILKLTYHPGEFIIDDSAIIYIYPGDQVTDEVEEALRMSITIGDFRTQGQDIDLLFNQLTEIAVRALSPGINAPVTAIMCIHRLGQALAQLGQHKLPSPYRYDSDSNLRIIASRVAYSDFLKISFDQIQYYGSSDLKVVRALIEILGDVAQVLPPGDNRSDVLVYRERTWRESREHLLEEEDRRELDQIYAALEVD